MPPRISCVAVLSGVRGTSSTLPGHTKQRLRPDHQRPRILCRDPSEHQISARLSAHTLPRIRVGADGDATTSSITALKPEPGVKIGRRHGKLASAPREWSISKPVVALGGRRAGSLPISSGNRRGGKRGPEIWGSSPHGPPARVVDVDKCETCRRHIVCERCNDWNRVKGHVVECSMCDRCICGSCRSKGKCHHSSTIAAATPPQQSPQQQLQHCTSSTATGPP